MINWLTHQFTENNLLIIKLLPFYPAVRITSLNPSTSYFVKIVFIIRLINIRIKYKPMILISPNPKNLPSNMVSPFLFIFMIKHLIQDVFHPSYKTKNYVLLVMSLSHQNQLFQPSFFYQHLSIN